MYLAFAGATLARPEDTRLAQVALASVDRLLERPERVAWIGGFDGWGGLLYAWLQIGLLWRDEGLLDRARDVLPRIAALIDHDEDLDLIRGGAGAIAPLLALGRVTAAPEPLALARRIGRRLIAAAIPFRDGLCWRTASFPGHPLTGLSHGTAGFAWALCELHAATGEASWRHAAERAVAFEHELFVAEEHNWRDLRPFRGELGSLDDASPAAYSVAWCHSASGIGWSRLRMWHYLRNDRLLEDVRVAAETTLSGGFGRNHPLCHGELGNLLFVREAVRTLADPALAARAEAQTEALLQHLVRHGPACGVPFAIESPGLMEGLAGIGYGLLQLAAPECVPNVLLLDTAPPPRQEVRVA